MTSVRGRLVAIISEGEREVHATDANGAYATLCGLDGDDPDGSVQQSSGGSVKRGEKITCNQCHQIWRQAKKYRVTDFAPAGRKAAGFEEAKTS